VSLEVRDGAPVVVKRFHHPNPILARFDRARARRERTALAELERAHLPVPRALDLRATPAGWELCCTAVEGARTLREFLADGAPPVGGWERLLARLGELLAHLQRAGWEHGDLHPGNVLVDACGEPWLIDLQRARRAALDPARCLDQVVECAAMSRERLPARVRTRFLVAWLEALPGDLRPRLQGAPLLRALEARARQRRLERVCAGLGRWLRESSRVRAIADDGQTIWLRRELDPGTLESLPASWLVLRGERDELAARWLGAARLAEHGLAAVRPAAFAPGPRTRARGAWAAFEPPSSPARSAAELGKDLEDRGLALRRPALRAPGDGVFLLPPREPLDFVELDPLA
jgi:tRNA A-37 threonylcarbamoyl transferase component Bud32